MDFEFDFEDVIKDFNFFENFVNYDENAWNYKIGVVNFKIQF